MTRYTVHLACLSALLVLGFQPARPTDRVCLAIGFGVWSLRGGVEDSVLAKSRLVQLLDRGPGNTPSFYGLSGWREALIGDGNSPSEYDHEWVWVAPTRDSLLLLRPAMMSAGISLRGQWHHDTLRGRAEAFGDAVFIGMPGQRANGFGVAYTCRDRGGVKRARTALARLQARDVPDTAQNSLEDSVENARHVEWLERLRAQ